MFLFSFTFFVCTHTQLLHTQLIIMLHIIQNIKIINKNNIYCIHTQTHTYNVSFLKLESIFIPCNCTEKVDLHII